MKCDAHITLHVRFLKTIKKRKFHYSYQFVSHGNKLRFRGMQINHFGVVQGHQKTTGRDWRTILFLYPGHSSNILTQAFSDCILKPDELPPEVSAWKTRKDIVLPKEVIKAAEKKCGLKVDTVMAKN